MQRILDSVWIGDYHSSQNIELLKTNKISHILAIRRSPLELLTPHPHSLDLVLVGRADPLRCHARLTPRSHVNLHVPCPLD